MAARMRWQRRGSGDGQAAVAQGQTDKHTNERQIFEHALRTRRGGGSGGERGGGVAGTAAAAARGTAEAMMGRQMRRARQRRRQRRRRARATSARAAPMAAATDAMQRRRRRQARGGGAGPTDKHTNERKHSNTQARAHTNEPKHTHTQPPSHTQDNKSSTEECTETLMARKADSTLRSSQAVPHPSTNRALRCLTSEVERDPVHSTRYGRRR